MPKPNLAAEICGVLNKHQADHDDGMDALLMTLLIGFLDDGVDKKAAIEWFSQSWDKYEPYVKRSIKLVNNVQ